MKNPIVSVIMGSDSDLPIMQDTAEILDNLGIAYECTIISAHRTPERAFDFAKNAVDRGIKVIIAGAGGAAHLAGVIAALTHIPVIGVPIKSRTLNGVDSLYSIVQMPSGIPVATVGINAAKNAGILAAQIIALGDRQLSDRLINYKKGLAEGVEEKASKLKEVGYKNYNND